MILRFYKYQGTGNDFVIIDNRGNLLSRSNKDIVAHLCNRKFGIGADGLMLLQNKEGYDFEMIYYNADGNESSMCGNGGRAIIAFAKRIGLIADKGKFLAIDGEHEAKIIKSESPNVMVSLKMIDVREAEINPDFYYLNTGSPHYVIFRNNVSKIDVYTEGKQIRNSNRFAKEGTNVNFVEIAGKELIVRTYERGVENETLSCGTGVTAAALCAALRSNGQVNYYDIQTPGGQLKVKFKNLGNGQFSNIWLEGNTTFVFKGEIEI